jgi:hypothetical protein
MRIAVGIVLLIDLCIRSLSIKAFFTDAGVLPITILKQYNWYPTYFSLHAISGELWWQIILFLLNAFFICLLIFGYRAKVVTIICWIFLTSMQNRNPFILQGGDDLLRLLLFWGIFLPWGERYSIAKNSIYKTSYFNLANIGYLLLPCSVFFFSALLKTSSEWRSEFTALYYALSLDQIRLPLGTFIYQFPNLLTVLTPIVFYIELIAPLLIIIPLVSKKARLVGIISITLLFVGIACTLYVGLFYIIGIVSLIGLLPATVINWFELHFYKNKTQFIKPLQHGIFAFKKIKMISVIKNYFIIVVISICLTINFTNLKNCPYQLSPIILQLSKTLKLEQNWGMFSPYILKDDGWFVYSGFNKQKKLIDIKHKKDWVSYKKPFPVVAEFESDRWRKFQENYIFNNNNYMRPFYCNYLIKEWNTKYPKKHITDLTIFFMKEKSLPNYKTEPIKQIAVCNCQDH